jgi:site-specific DNA-methyltransferase (adenine-specific)
LPSAPPWPSLLIVGFHRLLTLQPRHDMPKPNPAVVTVAPAELLPAELHLGDCMQHMASMRRRSVDVVLTDIPYGEVTRASRGLRNWDKGAADEVTFPLEDFVRECTRLSRGWVIIYCGTMQVSAVQSIFREERLVCVRVGVGHKLAPSPAGGKRGFLSAIEMIAFGKKPRAPFYGHCEHPVFSMPPIHYRKRTHPTEKPVATLKQILEAVSKPGDLIYDPCMGTGATGVAALDLGRRFIGVELNADHYADAERRLRPVRTT